MSGKRNIIWFRNDLRVFDHPALRAALDGASAVQAVYVVCPQDIKQHNEAACRIDFVRRNLLSLSGDLADLGIAIDFLRVEKRADIGSTIINAMQTFDANHLYFNDEYPWDERQRDDAVEALCKEKSLHCHRYRERLLAEPSSMMNGQGEPYKVFTPFKKALINRLGSGQWQPQKTTSSLPPIKVHKSVERQLGQAFQSLEQRDLSAYWPAGEEEANRRLRDFINHRAHRYHETRDYPADDTTSQLSPYLAAGVVSTVTCLSAAIAANHGEWQGENEGVSTWISELIWREFYQHVVINFPEVCRFKAFKPYTEHFPWSQDKTVFTRWCEGKTGVPIVDAAMRQLQETGWMHNRSRMIVAMFLTKNCRIDWRWGEAFFMQNLMDGDFASNNGGWQWSASTGTDAVPYFRIFNPVTQAERFDGAGDYIRRYVKELSHEQGRQTTKVGARGNYPSPVVDLSASRKKTIELFSELQKKSQ